MNEITKQDLTEAITSIKDHVNEKFEAQEKVAVAMFAPVKKMVEEHDIIFNGKDGRSGIIIEVQKGKTGFQVFKWMAGLGFGGMSLNWIKDLILLQ